MVVGDLLARNAHKYPAYTAIRQDGISITYTELNRRVNRLANALTERGLRQGDRIGVHLRTMHQFIEIYFAAAKAGAVFCPFNPSFREKELQGIIDYSRPRFLFFEDISAERIEAIRRKGSSPEQFVCLGAGPPLPAESPPLLDYEALVSEGNPSEPGVVVHDDDAMSIFFTSGTTGKPMGAVRTHRHLLTASYTVAIEERIYYGDRVLITSPLDHVSFESNLGRCFLLPNTAVLWRSSFDPEEILATLSRERITVGAFVPTTLNALMRVPDIRRFDLSSLRLVIYAGSPMPLELLKKAMGILGPMGIGFLQHYGLTESGPSITVLSPEDHVLDETDPRSARLTSVGRPVLDCLVRIVNEEGDDAAVGEVGEIIAKGETIMPNYWSLPEASAEKIRDGWLHTGDLGRFDKQGYIYLVDRKGDMIIRGGENVSPREIEEVLYTFPGILEATVIGVPDEVWGESIKALVVMREGISVSGRDIINFCAESLADYKKPQSVEFRQKLPKNPQGKILKRALRERYWSGTGRTL